MKKVNQITLIAMLLLSVCGLQVSAKDILPYGQFLNQEWEAKGFYQSNGAEAPSSEWTTTSYDDSSWQAISGPLSSGNGLPFYSTPWSENYSTYYVRRHFTLDEVNNKNSYLLYVSHDDACVVYLNGVELYNNSSCHVAPNYSTIALNEEFVSYLKTGDNVLAVKTIDTGAGEKFIDFGLYENDGNFNDIVSRTTNVELSFVNDAVFPWVCDGGYAQNGNTGNSYSKSALSFTFTTTRKSELTFDWMTNTTSNQTLSCFVDGVHFGDVNSSSYYTMRKYLDAGSHIVEFRDTISNTTATSRYARVKNIKVKEILPLESAVLTANSEKITFTNEGEWPWTIEDGYIQSSNYGHAYSASKFSTTFTIDKTSLFSYYPKACRRSGSSGSQSYQVLWCKINGYNYMDTYDRTTFDVKRCVALEPGTYTIEFVDTIYNTTTEYIAQIKDIELSSNWVDVELATAGSLGVEVLYKVDVLNDVQLLKVKGNLNATDWTNIKQMKNLIALDLSEAKFDALPDYAYDGLSYISSVKLPEGMKSIGQYAFRGTQIWKIEIPSSVKTIGQYAFADTRLASISFKSDSQLQSISQYAFYQCASLEEFIMPNTVTSLDRSVFYRCWGLRKLWLSDNLTYLPYDLIAEGYLLQDLHLPNNLVSIANNSFYGTTSLRHIVFPESLESIGEYTFYQSGVDSLKLPLKLSSLGYYAFYNCDNLKYIELPSYISSYNRNFYECSSIEKIVCQSATPPAISYDPFQNGRAKNAITLVVPSFAVVNYKLDTYWYQFGSIVEGDDIDYWKITSALALTNNRRMNGKPNIDLYYGGQLTVGGNAPMETGNINFYVSEGNPGRLLNDCSTFTADSINSYFSVESGRWYFFTPLHDVDMMKITHSANASFVFRYYDGESRATNGTGNSWRNVETGKLLAGQGYIFHCNANGIVTMPAEATGHLQVLNTTDVTKPLNAYEATASANKSWNYVGNPYPSYYDIYYMDFTAPITVWTGSTYKAYSIVDDNLVLRPMQAFFVQKPDEVDNIVFHKEGRQLTSAIERPSYAKAMAKAAPVSPRHFFNLQISNDDEVVDETRVVVNEDAMLSYEINSDASKFMSMENGVPQIFTLDSENNSYAINERPLSDGNVKVGYRAAASGFYTISAIRADGDATLYDNKMNKSIDLTSQDYTFYSEATESVDNSRFVLKLGVSTDPTGIDEAQRSTISVTGTNGNITISGAIGCSVIVYTADGRQVYNGVSNNATMNIAVPNGAYIVKVNNSTFKTAVF